MFYIISKLICSLLFVTLVTTLKQNKPYLSVSQWKTIQSLITNEKTTSEMRSTISNVLYKCCEGYAVSSAHKFQQFHKYKCTNINTFELVLYAKFGLYKAAQKYNGSSSFISYADKYISGALYKGLTDLYPLSSVKKSDRRMGKYNKKKKITTNNYKTQFIGYDNYWMFDKYFHKLDNDNLKKIIYFDDKNRLFDFINNNLDPFTKKVFYYKYDNELNVIRSNHHIAELMVCSEEQIRKSLLDFRNQISVFFSLTV